VFLSAILYECFAILESRIRSKIKNVVILLQMIQSQASNVEPEQTTVSGSWKSSKERFKQLIILTSSCEKLWRSVWILLKHEFR